MSALQALSSARAMMQALSRARAEPSGAALGTARAARGMGLFAIFLCAAVVAGCQTGANDGAVSYDYPNDRREKGVSLLSTGSGGLFGGSDDGSGAKIGVNALLWRAALDTVSFMPLASADPFGGVIITDWYSDPATPGERFKASVYILDQRLRADAVRVSLFRQVKRGGGWGDAAVSAGAERQLEDQILTRARQMRIAGSEG